MPTTKQTQLVVMPQRMEIPGPQPEITIGGKQYSYDQLEGEDWASVDQNQVNDVNNDLCR